MKKLFVVIGLLMFWLNSYSVIRYFSTTGSDATGTGTIGNPYASLGKAASVAVSGDIIHGNAGTYTQTTQVIVAPGVSIEGVGSQAGGTRINLTFTVTGAGGFNSMAIQLVTATVNNNIGNQSITGIWFDGSNFACYGGILVRCRSNVTIDRCKFTNFANTAVLFNGKTSNTTGLPPATFSQNNKVTNCTFLECSDRIIGTANMVSCGSITYSGQRNILFQYDTLSNTTKAQGHNGNLFSSVQGNNIGTKWLNCIFTKPADEGNQFNFGIENWYDMGGTEYAYNTYTGGGNAIDIGYGSANRGDSTYSWYIHDNIFTNAALLTGNPGVQPVLSIAIQFESSTNISLRPQNATIGDAIITNNKCHNVGIFVQIGLSNYSLDFIDNIYINHNVLENMGFANSTYSAVFQFGLSNGVRIDSIFVDNNTILSNTGTGSSKGIMILQCDAGVISNIFFRNNIAMNVVNGYAYLVFRGTQVCDRIFAQSNIVWNNAFTNNSMVFVGSPAPTNYTTTPLNIKQAPQFVSSPTDLHLVAGSVGTSGGLNPPATYMGAYPPGTITPTITWNNPAPITYGTALSGVQLNATSGGVSGTFFYTPAAGTILNAGIQTLNVVFTPTDQATYSVVSKNVTITVNKATATLAYSNLTQTYTGSPLQPTITTTPAGLTVVNTTYNGLGTIPSNAGSYTIISGLTNDNYAASPITGTFTINKATATISLSGLSQVYNGTQRPITATTTPVGLTGLAATYNGSGTPPTNAGSYTVNVTLTNTNYTATPVTGTLVVSKATPTISWSNPANIVYGTTLSGTQLNATASVPGTFTYTPPSGTILNAGSQILSLNFQPTDNTNYNPITDRTVTLIVTKATATIALSNLAQTYNGTPKSATATTTPAGLNTVTITYNGSSTPPTNAGSYTVVASLSNPNYTATNATGTLVISKATATLSLSNLAQTYNGTPRTVTVTTAPPGLTVVAITYNGSSTAPTNAGTYPIVATLTNANYQGSTTGTLVVAKATPVISWSNPAAITYGTALSGTQLNATSGGVPGTFTYSPPSGTVLSAGTQTLSVNFVPTNTTNYNTVNGTSVTLIVNKATATISLSNLTQSYTGSQISATATTTPAGLTVVSITYNGSPTPPTNAGSYAVVASLTNPNYTATNATGTLVINKATATLSLGPLTQTYDGTPQTVSVTTAPAGLTVVSVTYNGSSTPPTNAGSYAIVASLTNANYQATNATGTLVINKADPIVTWSNPAAITYGTALSGTQLNAIANVAGTFTYTPPSGTVLNAGTQTLSVNFAPTDAVNYNSVNGTSVSIVVNKATATINLSNLAQDFDGNPKPVTVTTTPAGLGVIAVTYNGSPTAPSAVGSYTVNATLTNTNYTATPAGGTLVISSSAANINITNTSQTYTGSPLPVTVTTIPPALPYLITYNGSSTVPTNVGSYVVIATINDGGIHTGADTQTLVINKATPVITWGTPAAITYGTALSGTQLNATASVPGTFTYTPASGTILNAGTAILSVSFTPTDAANYNSVPTTTVSIVVNKATATLTLSNLNQNYDGTQKAVTVTSSPVGLFDINVTYDGSPTEPSAVGSYAVIATLTNSNYTATPANGTLVISMAAATVTITNINQTYTGSPLPVTVTTNPSGISTSVTYNGSLVVPTNAGTYAVVATIDDGIHTGSSSATYVIAKATPTVSWSTPAAITYGTALSGTQLNATASVAGTFTYSPPSGTILNSGTQPLSVNFTPADAANYNSVTGTTVNIVVNTAAATLSLSNLNQAYDGTPKTVTVTTSPAALTVIAVTYDGSNVAPTAVGSYAVVATLNNSNYTATPATGTLVISTTPGGITISNLNQTYTGGTLPVTVTTNPSGISNTVTYNGSATLPINVGTYTVIATLTDGIHTGADTQTLVVNKATPIVTWNNPADIVFGTALSGTQLNATANAPGGFTYTPTAGTVLNVGAQSLSVVFTPTDLSNYNPVTKTVTITVTGASATLTLSNLSQVYNGTPRSVIVTTSPAGLAGVTILYNGSSVAPTNAGSYAVSVTLVNANYTATPVIGTLVVAKINPVLSWIRPAQIVYPAPLTVVQLNATANIAGTFTYTPPIGTVLNPGTTTIVATFHPTDLVNYNNNVIISVPLSVAGSPLLLWFITHGNTFYDNLPGQVPPPP